MSPSNGIPVFARERKPFRYRLLKVLRMVNVVPVVLLKLAADHALYYVEEEVRLQRHCRLSLDFTAEECSLMKNPNFTHVKNAALEIDEGFNMTTKIISVPLSLLIVILAASWSDRHGRLHFLRFSIIGYFLAAVFYALFTVMDTWDAEVLLTAVVLRSMVGGPSLFTMIVYCIMVDKTNLQMRTLRLGLLTNMVVLGQALGFVAGILLENLSLGPLKNIILALFLYFSAFLFTIYMITEDPLEFQTRFPPRYRNTCLDFLHPSNFYDFFSVTFKPRKGKGRLQLQLILVVTFFIMLSPPHLMKQWTMTCLHWDLWEYNPTSAATMITTQVTTLVVLRSTRKNPIPDCLLTTIGEGMTVIQCLLLAVIHRPELSFLVFIAAAFALSHNLAIVGVRAASSKVCEPGEVGRVYGVMAIQEILMSWPEELGFQKMWDVTREILPTAQHLLSAPFGLFNALIMLAVFKSNASAYEEVETKKQDDECQELEKMNT